MKRTTGSDLPCVLLGVVVFALSGAAWAQEAPDAGASGGRRIVVVPAAPNEPQGQRIVVVPNNGTSPAPSQSQQRVVVVPNNGPAPAPSQSQQRIVVVPNNGASPAQQSQQRVVVVPNSGAAQPSGPQQRIVVVPSNGTAPAQQSQPQQRIVVVPNNGAALAPSQPQQRIVVVPNTGAAQQSQQRVVVVPNSGTAQPSGSQQRIVVVPNTGTSSAQQPQQRIVVVPNTGTAPAQQSQQRIVVVPNTEPAPSQPQQRVVIVPAPNGGAAASAPSQPLELPDLAMPDGAAPGETSTDTSAEKVASPEVTPNRDSGSTLPTPEPGIDEESAPSDEETGTASMDDGSPDDEGGLHVLTAHPDVAPRSYGSDGDLTGSSAAEQVANQGSEGTSAEGASAVLTDVPRTSDDHPREGPFLSGPGSLAFILHHTLMGAAGGFATQGISSDFSSDTGGKEAILAGTLVGAGIGFGTSAWWQFNHWIGHNTANFGIVNSLSGGMFLTGLLDLTTDDPTALAWSSFLGAEVGGWLTAGMGGGDLSLDTGMLIASGQAWGAVYGALLMGIVRFSGSSLRTEAAVDTLFITQGAGAILTAFLSARFHPSLKQILRADIAGAIVGGAVLLISSLVLGHLDSPTPYALSMATSASTMALVSIFWDEGGASVSANRASAPYRSLW